MVVSGGVGGPSGRGSDNFTSTQRPSGSATAACISNTDLIILEILWDCDCIDYWTYYNGKVHLEIRQVFNSMDRMDCLHQHNCSEDSDKDQQEEPMLVGAKMEMVMRRVEVVLVVMEQQETKVVVEEDQGMLILVK